MVLWSWIDWNWLFWENKITSFWYITQFQCEFVTRRTFAVANEQLEQFSQNTARQQNKNNDKDDTKTTNEGQPQCGHIFLIWNFTCRDSSHRASLAIGYLSVVGELHGRPMIRHCRNSMTYLPFVSFDFFWWKLAQNENRKDIFTSNCFTHLIILWWNDNQK